jgi:hypothetical protein
VTGRPVCGDGLLISNAVVRHYHFNPKESAKIDHRIRKEFVPIVKKAKGCVHYYWLDTGKGEGARPSASLRTKPVLVSRYSWLRITYKRICLNFAFRNPRLSKARSKLTIDRPQSGQSRLHMGCVTTVDARGRERSLSLTCLATASASFARA